MFELSIDEAGSSPRLAIVTIDDQREVDGTPRSVNALSPEVLDEVESVFDTIEATADVDGAILISGKPDNFIAGADVETFANETDRRNIEEFARRGHALLNRMASAKKPIVCAIHGACLGGGLEVALACQWRVCTDSPKTVLAFPEIMLGLFPGGGGVTRLPRLIGLREALDIILTGRNVRPKKARKLGLVDQVVAPEALLAAARRAAAWLAAGKIHPRGGPEDDLVRTALEGNVVGRRVVLSQARKMTQKKTYGLYPAPFVALDVIEKGMGMPLKKALALEPPAFAELAVGETSRSLVSLFRRSNALKKQSIKHKNGRAARGGALDRLGMVGGGFMGADIAAVSADKGMTSRIREIAPEPLGSALAHARASFDRRARSVGEKNVYKARGRVSGGLSLAGFETMDLIIEAVPEVLEIKQGVFAELDGMCPKTTVLASNTSALPIASIAEKVKHKGRVVGLHFFSPVHKMPLLEIVRTPDTSPKTLATCLAYSKKIGKTPIVVADGPGFYTTRVLGFYLMAALEMIRNGHSIEQVDRGARKVGWPVGPLALMDEVGIDVGAKVSQTLSEAWPERIELPDTVEKFIAKKHFGRKSGRGFYLYPSKGKKEVDESVYAYFGSRPSQAPRASEEELGERLTLIAAMEAVRCLEEDVVESPRDGDVGAVFGFGYPPMRGGPFRHIDLLGADTVVRRLDAFADRHGAAYEVPALLRDLHESGKTFAEMAGDP
jgi:3-hydroxyacyl-CoA dehydrogenase/enoyl-CoA hydratase/3-hydroxybutyryl-CoA epimerase